ncbi:major outer sheath C-terminal domain-containing protein [Treponema paraluiscuniculi]|uniref:major outer sheath C-terminal domain-containing protein n=1 Tax=Treponema paraluiscuniculi TaxID=53435 RepID=UPI0009FCE08A|nr:major outer sheath C-terminal domain-containing protein [Treponema paraluiscuniculi]
MVSPLEKVEVRLSWEQGKLQENSNVVIEKNVTERWQFVGAVPRWVCSREGQGFVRSGLLRNIH